MTVFYHSCLYFLIPNYLCNLWNYIFFYIRKIVIFFKFYCGRCTTDKFHAVIQCSFSIYIKENHCKNTRSNHNCRNYKPKLSFLHKLNALTLFCHTIEFFIFKSHCKHYCHNTSRYNKRCKHRKYNTKCQCLSKPFY